MGVRAHYVIELVSENYDRLSEAEKTKTLIHELLHIPATFGGGFRNHDYVHGRRVNKLYERYASRPLPAPAAPPPSPDAVQYGLTF